MPGMMKYLVVKLSGLTCHRYPRSLRGSIGSPTSGVGEPAEE